MTIVSVRQISKRYSVLTFDDEISVIVLFGDFHTFVCDTHLGPESMEDVKKFLSEEPSTREVIIFNSHSDWDHVWGNCAFKGVTIVGHNSCRKRLFKRGNFDLKRNYKKTRGAVILTPPNLTFETKLCFEDDDVEFIHAPGHTIDSSICLDRRENILYVGDLVEDPIPYLDYDRLDIYLNTLERILAFQAKIVVSAHSGIVDTDLIKNNIRYVQSVQKCTTIDSSSLGELEEVHRLNINNLVMLRFEKIVRARLQGRFDFDAFWSTVSEPDKITPDALEKRMKDFLEQVG
ncbi:MAG: MBL fold metallo-hydrolase [Methanomicrobiales archaeon]|nr:MBL fold metallo-hydrolase [Methanomicrobiales archaeon]